MHLSRLCHPFVLNFLVSLVLAPGPAPFVGLINDVLKIHQLNLNKFLFNACSEIALNFDYTHINKP